MSETRVDVAEQLNMKWLPMRRVNPTKKHGLIA